LRSVTQGHLARDILVAEDTVKGDAMLGGMGLQFLPLVIQADRLIVCGDSAVSVDHASLNEEKNRTASTIAPPTKKSANGDITYPP
jgi:hypothetical protein